MYAIYGTVFRCNTVCKVLWIKIRFFFVKCTLTFWGRPDYSADYKISDCTDTRVYFSKKPQNITYQCPKLRVHPAPGVHISTAGDVHPVCARFLSHLLLLCIGRVHGAISGCIDLWEVHPVSAENKSLISDTAYLR